MNKKEALNKIKDKAPEWLDMSFISTSIATCNCMCNKDHKMFYSKKTGTFSCPICGFSNLDLFEVTKLALGQEISTEDVAIRIIRKYMKSDTNLMKAIVEGSELERKEREKFLIINNEALSFFQANLRKSREALYYLKKRGFSVADIEKYQIGYAPGYNMLFKQMKDKYPVETLEKLGLIGYSEKTEKYYDVFRDRIIFPILNEHKEVVGFSGRVFKDETVGGKYVNTKATPLFVKNEILYNLYKMVDKKSSTIFVCEGFMDVISLEKNGFLAVCTMGTAFTPKHLEKLKKITDNIIMLFDGDEPGIKAAHKALSKVQANSLFLPEGLDPDEFIQQKGKEGFKKYLNENLKNWNEWKLSTISTTK